MLAPELLKNSKEVFIKDRKIQGSSIYLLITFSVIGILCALPFIRVDISVSSLGVIQPITERSPILAPVSGKIQAVYVSENESLKKGQKILSIGIEKFKDREAYLNTRMVELKSYIQDLQVLTQFEGEVQPDKLSSSIYIKSLLKFQNEKAQLELTLDKSRRVFKRTNQLFQEKVIPEVEYENAAFSFAQDSNRLVLLVNKQVSIWSEELRESRNQLNITLQEFQSLQVEKEQFTLYAPLDGAIQGIGAIQAGNFLYQGNKIGEISPDTTLVVSCFISPKDIGYIRQGQKIKLSVDAFNYNEWGFVGGQVQDISKDIILIEQGKAAFTVKCTLDSDHLTLKNGYRGYLKKGMSVSSRFMLARRSLFQLLYDKVDNWMNPQAFSE